MNNNTLYQLGLAAKIWLVAVIMNALLGALLIGFSNGGEGMWEMFLLILMVGGLFSIPCLVTVFLLIRLLTGWVGGILIFLIVAAGGVAVTVLVFNGLMQELGEGDRDNMRYMLVVTIIAALAGVVTFYKPLMKQGREFYHPEKV